MPASRADRAKPDLPERFHLSAGETFLEPPCLEGSLGLAIKVDRVLCQERTEYQDLAIIEAGPLGRILLLDGNIQVSQFDEPAYHEMMVHVPMLSHPDPKRVLIIGGGDGGALREVLKHESVQEAHICEIDKRVVELSRRHLAELASGFDHPKTRLHIGDGFAFLAGHKEAFDLIIVDSSDPEGPAEGLFGPDFYRNLKQALRPGGIAVSQMESCHLYAPLISRIFEQIEGMFETSYYYTTMVATYLSGVIGFAFNSLGPDPLAPVDQKRLQALGELDYYNPTLHRAAFALPCRWLKLLPPETARRQA
ncbi:polyamine aminopropyltransferase [Dethiosulfatarculus sandiegensis]|uniref:Polyamine aminopropyltransferase n=1 Tax=Dethiosulfatarculus sandiegensis TaxID=1429043 RepID=A0A0D2HJ90_9BACT|nr:polyamine aminopropyltransferase [Dethiosulfatarculus sandiegensis]KIX10743.1 spermidine synthase [Dethiosulfatarculus sandiegensis]